MVKADNPRDFLAALGILRIVQLSFAGSRCGLSWDRDAAASFIDVPGQLDLAWAEGVHAELKALTQVGGVGLVHGKIIRTGYAAFRTAIESAIGLGRTGSPLSPLPELLYAAYASQLPSDEGEVEPTAFSFGNGQSGKNLLLDVSELVAELGSGELLATITGSAKRAAMKSLRLSPAEFRAAAYRAHDPGSKVSGDALEDYPWLNVFAFIGLSFFPTVATPRGARTIGFRESERQWEFVYPLWSASLEPDEVASLLASDAETWRPSRGVFARWSTIRFSSDKSLYFSRAQAC